MTRRTSRKPVRKNSRRRSSRRRTGLTDALIDNIKTMTERNAHSEAVMALAQAVGLPGIVDDVRELLRRQGREGYIHHIDVQHLNDVRNALLGIVKLQTNSDFYKRLHAAF